MITADTITVRQIRELIAQLEHDQQTAKFALLDDPHTDSIWVEVRKARARCAEILNARNAAVNP